MEQMLSLKLLSTEGSQLLPLPTAMEVIILPGIKRLNVLSKNLQEDIEGTGTKLSFISQVHL